MKAPQTALAVVCVCPAFLAGIRRARIYPGRQLREINPFKYTAPESAFTRRGQPY